jgi:hypothetical protein
VQGPVPARTAADLSTQQITQPLIDAYAILKPEQVVHTGGYAAQAVAHGSHYQNAVVHVPQNMPAGIVYVQKGAGAGAGAGYGPAQPQLGQQVQQYGGATIAYQQQPSQQQQQQQQQLQQQLQQQQLQQQYAAQSVAYSGQCGVNPSTAATMIMMQQPTLQQLQSPQQFQPSQYYQQPQQQQHSPIN